MTIVYRIIREGTMNECKVCYKPCWEAYSHKECEEECPHDEHDHGICLDCGKDIFNDLVAQAEFAADCREDR